jgi:hypothetical protein
LGHVLFHVLRQPKTLEAGWNAYIANHSLCLAWFGYLILLELVVDVLSPDGLALGELAIFTEFTVRLDARDTFLVGVIEVLELFKFHPAVFVHEDAYLARQCLVEGLVGQVGDLVSAQHAVIPVWAHAKVVGFPDGAKTVEPGEVRVAISKGDTGVTGEWAKASGV